MTSQEDDATELSFPKGLEALDEYLQSVVVNDSMMQCNSCLLILHYPYILCSDCESLGERVTICVYCFSKGKEFHIHLNDHNYIIVKDEPIFGNTWKGSEELQLLEEIFFCGIGNWGDISKNMSKKTEEECKNHYMKYFIEDQSSDELSELIQYKSKPVVAPFEPSLGILDPPRPFAFSHLHKNMCGYNAARGDFTVEYNDGAENLMNVIDPELLYCNDGLIENLQMAAVDIYRRQLAEREFKKRVIREHGFINLKKLSIMHNFYKSALPCMSTLIPALHNILSQEEIIFFLEGFCHEDELKTSIMDLREYRINGLQTQGQVSLYDTLKKRRESLKRQRYKLVAGSDTNVLYAKEILNINLGNQANSLKRASAPLDITGEAEYDTLNKAEQNLASVLRIFPSRYNNIKTTMITECQKLNGIQLRYARTLFKIDVNKVKRIYDYLMEKKLIYKPIP